MKKVRKEFRNVIEVLEFLRTIKVNNDVKNEIEKIVKNIEETLGHPYAEISNYKWIGNTYRKEFYVSDIVLTPNSYNESFNANIRVKTENVRLIVLINYFKYDYNYNGNESGEKAILKIAYID